MHDTVGLADLLDETAGRQNLIVGMRREDQQPSIAGDDESRRARRRRAAAIAANVTDEGKKDGRGQRDSAWLRAFRT
jgi:hypothetical protein